MEKKEANPAATMSGATTTLGRIEFTAEQRATISKVAGREITAANLVELSTEDAKALAPGILRASAIVMCW